MPRKPIEAVLRDHTPELLRIPEVVGTGQGMKDGRPAIVVMLKRSDPTLMKSLPREIEGYPVDLRVVGDVSAPPP
jgi:hypothetical protein